MPNNEYLFTILIVGYVVTIIALVVVLASKMERIKQLRLAVDNLKKSLDEMDEQAKLIVRTDMELNKIQDELDKKVTGLYALQRLSRAMSTTLEEGQIFKAIACAQIEDLGFEKAYGFLWREGDKKFMLHLAVGSSEEEAEKIKSAVERDKDIYLDLINNGKTVSSLSLEKDPAFKEKLCGILGVKSFVISPVCPQQGSKGFLFVGTKNEGAVVTEGDEELIIILANHIGQALENARLFEQTWQAQQELEKKVEERTRQLSLALDEVQKISKRKSDFVSSVSHELRTPLTSIKGYASILISGQLGKIPEDVRLRLEKINQRSDELVQFINDLLDISRIESGKATMKQEPVNLIKITDEIADTLSLILKEKQIVFSVDIPGNITVFADYNQIKRVFINLINNASKYTPAKGKITIKAKKLDKEIQVDIADTGCGIPEEAQAKLFQEFYRVDSEVNQQVKGTGLGLALVKNIIGAHKGKIWAKSTVGSGSTFSFTLPLAS